MAESSKQPERRSALATLLRLYGIVVGAVLTFSFEVVAFTLLGYWLDGWWSSRPWLTVTGAFVGSSLGMYHLVLAVRWVLRER